MNTLKIEKRSIGSLRNVIDSHDLMNEHISENDKGPSWDGEILLYSDERLRVEDIKYRIPVQVKGKNDERYLKRQSITFPVEYRHLRNYYRDGGVCYFVIVISDDGKQTAIFYNALTPVKLKALLSQTESKKPEQTQNIALRRLKKNDARELHKILLQFGHDSAEQGTGELVRKSIHFEDMENIDEIRATGFVEDQEEMIRNINSGEICLFGHRGDADIWLPFSYEEQTRMRLVRHDTIQKPISVNGQIYYDSFELEKKEDGGYLLILSENLSIDMEQGKFHFRGVTKPEYLKQDLLFLRAIQQANEILVEGEPIIQYSDLTASSSMNEQMEEMWQIIRNFEMAGVRCGKRLDAMSEEDWDAITKLNRLYAGEIIPKEDSAWYIWRWNDRIVPFFLMKYSDGTVEAQNILIAKDFVVRVGDDEHSYRLPRFVHYKRDVWEDLYDVEEEVLLEDLEQCDFNAHTEEYMALLLLEVLSAYDSTKNEKYFDLSMCLSEKILASNPGQDDWKINRLQVLKRKRELSDQELEELARIENESTSTMVKCAANILMENKYKARKQLEAMSVEDREVFCSYPIYHLY